MHLILGSLVAGAIAGEGTRRVHWRPFLKSAIKQGIRLTRNVQTLAAQTKEEANLLVAEAKAELDRPRAQRQS
jgi:hypothetical protein